jgi:hypothetical protein
MDQKNFNLYKPNECRESDGKHEIKVDYDDKRIYLYLENIYMSEVDGCKRDFKFKIVG